MSSMRCSAQRAEAAPAGLTATATHDTKRGEDARMRILALAELAPEWDAAVQNWRELNAPLVQQVGGKRSPSIGHEYMLYQALIGAWPGAVDAGFHRTHAGLRAESRARRPSRRRAGTNPDPAYEEALRAFVGKLLDRASFGALSEVVCGLSPRARRLLGALNGLSQLALKALTPGVPDFYQGTELWDLSLVDPDNRRAVDFDLRAARTGATSTLDWRRLADNWPDGRIKLALTQRAAAAAARICRSLPARRL